MVPFCSVAALFRCSRGEEELWIWCVWCAWRSASVPGSPPLKGIASTGTVRIRSKCCLCAGPSCVVCVSALVEACQTCLYLCYHGVFVWLSVFPDVSTGAWM